MKEETPNLSLDMEGSIPDNIENPPSSAITPTMRDPVQEYFERYPDFVYDPSAPPPRQFDRLVQQNHWPIGSLRFQTALSQTNAALFQQFDRSIEIPGPPFVEPEPEPIPESASVGDSSSMAKAAKRARKKAKKMMRKAAKKALEIVEGSSTNVTNATGAAPSQEGLAEIDGNSKVEETVSSAARPIPGDVRTVPSQTMQLAAGADVDMNNTSDRQQSITIPMPDTTNAGAKLDKAKSRPRKKAKRNKSVVTVVSVPVGELSAYLSAGLERREARPTSSGEIAPSNTESTPPVVIPRTPLNPIDAFFGKYPEFDANRDRTLSVATQLNQLRKQEEWWGDRYGLWVDALEKYHEALVLQFNASYGTDAENLENWHRLLRAIGGGLRKTVYECKVIISMIYVNIVDLVDVSLDPAARPVNVVFDSVRGLSDYTVSTRKYFPKKHAAAGSLLKRLLRQDI